MTPLPGSPPGLPTIDRAGVRTILAEQARTRALLEHPGDLSPLEELRVRRDYAAKWSALGVLVEDLLNEVERLEALVPAVPPKPDHGGWMYEENGYIHAQTGWQVGGNGMRSWLTHPDHKGIVQERPCDIQGVTRHGFTARADVAALMDYADEQIAKEKR